MNGSGIFSFLTILLKYQPDRFCHFELANKQTNRHAIIQNCPSFTNFLHLDTLLQMRQKIDLERMQERLFKYQLCYAALQLTGDLEIE